MAQMLSQSTLAALPPGIAQPAYDPRSLRAGIVHVGVGNFHRAHQAVYLDELFALGESHAFGIVGAGIRDADRAMRDALAGQDYLSTVVAQEGTSAQARVTAAMLDFVDPATPTALVDALADPTIRICSLTVTEGGYCVDAATGRFDAHHADIAADVGPALGAAGLARIGAGVPAREAFAAPGVAHGIEPERSLVDELGERRAIFRSLYRDLATRFAQTLPPGEAVEPAPTAA